MANEKNQRVAVEAADFDAFKSEDFWRKSVFNFENDPEVDDPFPELDDVTLEFRVSADSASALLLDLDLDVDMYTLFIDGPGTGNPIQLGWWDLARWMPYALRWQELDALSRCIARRITDERLKGLPLLLLSRFVPTAQVDGPETVRQAMTAAWQGLKLFESDEIADLVGAMMGGGLEGNAWSWQRDPNLGWVLAGEEADGYSLRYKGNETFPFSMVNELFDEAEERAATLG